MQLLCSGSRNERRDSLGSVPRAVADQVRVHVRRDYDRRVPQSLRRQIYGLDFISIHAIGAMVEVTAPRRIDARIAARVNLAGQALDALFADDLGWTLDSWLECAERPVDEGNDDITNTPPVYLADGAIWGLAFVQANADLLREVADAVERAGGLLPYRDFEPFKGRAVEPSDDAIAEWSGRLMGEHAERLVEIMNTLLARS